MARFVPERCGQPSDRHQEDASDGAAHPSSRLAICVVRPDLIAAANLTKIVQQMTDLGIRLGRTVDDTTVFIDTAVEGPWTTIAAALGRTHATDVIVPNLGHVDGIDYYIRQRVRLITLVGEHVLEKAHLEATA
jgi:hypothetical protein